MDGDAIMVKVILGLGPVYCFKHVFYFSYHTAGHLVL